MIFFLRKSCRSWDVEKYGRATDDNNAHALSVPDNYGKNTQAHLEYFIFLVFAGQQYERASMLGLRYKRTSPSSLG
jgi:hypothetical protein